jgi:hypothetical protein
MMVLKLAKMMTKQCAPFLYKNHVNSSFAPRKPQEDCFRSCWKRYSAGFSGGVLDWNEAGENDD